MSRLTLVAALAATLVGCAKDAETRTVGPTAFDVVISNGRIVDGTGNAWFAGDVGIATFRMLLVNMLEGRFISPYDDEIATRIATVLCGGEIDRGSLVDEEWLLRLERRHFVELAQQPRTQERIAHMLKTGKPLRN